MQTHRPLFWITLAFMLGIALEAVVSVPFMAVMISLVLSAVIAALCFRWRVGVMFMLIAFAALGVLCERNATTLPRDHVVLMRKFLGPGELAVKGVVDSDIDVREAGRGIRVSFTLKVSELCREARCRKASGKVLVRMFAQPDFNYGDEAVVVGKLHQPFEFSQRGQASYRDYLRHRGILRQLTVRKANVPVVTGRGNGNPVVAASLRCRSAFARVYERHMSPKEAGLMTAFMLGDRSGIPPHVYELFRRTGTAHIIAISGLNIAMLAFMIFLALGVFPLGRRLQTALTVVLIWTYTFLVGGGSPVVRAAVMSSVFLLSFVIEREQDTLNTLAASALAILVFDPEQLFDIGFQLSFVCVLSLVLWSPLLLGPLAGRGWPKRRPVLWFLIESLAVSLSAWLGSAGLVAYYFGMVTPVGLLANLPVVPLSAVVTALGAVILLVAFLIPPLTPCFAACLKASLNLMVLAIWLCNRIPGGNFWTTDVSLRAVGIYYLILAVSYTLARSLVRRLIPAHEVWNLGL